jgi:hypothetical protein
MNSLLIKAGVPQMRCKATGGKKQALSYEVMVSGHWVPCNYQIVRWWVGYVRVRSRKVTACLKKSKRWTGTTKIGGALWYTSWASTEQGIASSSCVQVTRMNAPSLLNNSGENLRGSYER